MDHNASRDQDRENRARIRAVLMQKWDPTGISGKGPDDEYDSYINTILSMLSDERANHRRIADHLLGVAVNAMGPSDRPGLKEKCILAADALVALRPLLTTRGTPRC